MAIQQHALEKVQFSLTTAAGTPTNPPTDMYLFPHVFGALNLDGQRVYPRAGGNTFVAHKVKSTRPSIGGIANLNMEGVSWRDMVLLGELGFQGGVSPSGAGPYTWTYDGQSTSDDLARMSMQAGGSQLKMEALGYLMSQLELKGTASNGRWDASMTLVGQKPTKESAFEATTDYAQGTSMGFSDDDGLAVYLDDTAGGIGTTQLDCQSIKEITIRMNNQVASTDTACGRVYGRNLRYVEVIIRVNLTSDIADEIEHNLADDIRYVQIYVPNAASSPTDFWQFNVAGFWQPFTLGEDGPFRDTVLTLRGEQDASLGYDWQSVVQTDISTVAQYE